MAAPVFAQHGGDADLSAKALQPADGLKVETFASDPLFFNPVAFTIDEKGRFFISETHRYKDSIFDIWRADDRWKMNDFSFRTVEERAKFLAQEYATNFSILTNDSEIIRLVEDKDGDGRADTSSVFADGFNKSVSGTAAGILARKGELWFTCIPDLWKFKYDSAGKMLHREILHTGYGVKISVSGHDLHGLALGPDGKIYFSVGDRGANVLSKEGKQLDSIDTGCVFRCNPDGTELEIFATGVRNPQELAFDEFGNLWAHDNDTAGEDKSRVLYIVEGGEYGWRQSYQFMENFGPWVQEKVWQGNIDDVLPPAGYGAQGPSGLAFYPGVGLPEKYKGALLGCDFPQGIWAYLKTSNGAGYEIEREKFLWGFGCTDVAIGPDCNVYASDWGRSYNMPDAGKIYRVFDPAQTNNAAIAEVKKLLVEGVEGRTIEQLAKLLGHADARVRTEAQFELVRRNATGTIANALQNGNQLARIHAIWAAKQIGADNVEISAKISALFTDSDPEIRAQSVSAFPLPIFQKTFERLLKDENPRVRFFAAMGLGKLKSRGAIEPLLAMIKENRDQDPYLVHAGVWALVNIGDFSAINKAAKNENASVRRAALLSMRRMKRPEVAQFLNDSEPRLVLEAARAINDAPVFAALPQLAATLEKSPVVLTNEAQKNSYLSRAVNANFRLGQEKNSQSLARFVSGKETPDKLRAEALNALADWENPSPLDRVVGIYRPVTTARTALSQTAVGTLLNEQLRASSADVVLAAIRAAQKLKAVSAMPALRDVCQRENVSVPAKIAALQALANLNDPELHQSVEIALASKDTALRSEGIKLAGQLDAKKAAPLLEKILATETDFRIGQSALATLGDLKDAAADSVLAAQLQQLLDGKLRPELRLDLLEAASKRTAPIIREKLGNYKNGLPKDDPLAEFRVCISGGDSEAGKKLFNENDAIGCLRCHAIKGKGGVVGPDLAGIASKHQREYFIESILLPNKTIAPGFENVTIVLKNGTSYAGLVKSETDAELVLNSPEDGLLTLQKNQIEKRNRSLSAMPEGLGQLVNKRDLRNIVEYLSKLK